MKLLNSCCLRLPFQYPISYCKNWKNVNFITRFYTARSTINKKQGNKHTQTENKLKTHKKAVIKSQASFHFQHKRVFLQEKFL